jgi:hypothetical protein
VWLVPLVWLVSLVWLAFLLRLWDPMTSDLRWICAVHPLIPAQSAGRQISPPEALRFRLA